MRQTLNENGATTIIYGATQSIEIRFVRQLQGAANM